MYISVVERRNISPQVVQAHKMDVLSQITGGRAEMAQGSGMGRGQSVAKRGGKVVKYGFSNLGQGGYGPANKADSGFSKPNIQPGQAGLGQPNIGQGGFSQTNMGLGGSGQPNISQAGIGQSMFIGGEKWNCSKCTFENQPQSTQCEMCKCSRA
jgi:hypothetical protein